jgi:hypothetical protein
MSWYRDADKSKDLNYSPPKVTEQNLDAAGNYVSPAAAAENAGGTGITPLSGSGGKLQ